jgi:hypothetical protein
MDLKSGLLKKTGNKKFETAEMKFLRSVADYARKDQIRKEPSVLI